MHAADYKLKADNSSGIVLKMFEHISKNQISEYSLPVNLNNVYSKFNLAPLNNINFGAMQFNTTKTRTIEIKNEGLFEII